jgi:hypothetical protein
MQADLVVGAGTHLDTHTAAMCDARGRVVSQLQVPANTAGYVQLLAWARSAAGDCPVAWAVEGTRHYGSAVPARATRSTLSARPANCWPARRPRRCAPTGTAKLGGC